MASVAVGAKTARACGSCLRTRARWHCAAADAFLCQNCDSAVHLANSLARWHECVRLKTSSTSATLKAHLAIDEIVDDEPTWHHGCKRKARTPRGGTGKEHLKGRRVKFGAVVPEIGTPSSEEESTVMDEGEQLIHQVPIYDPTLLEFCSPPAASDYVKQELAGSQPVHSMASFEGLPGLLAPDMDLGEYEMDMESLLGRGLDEESFSMKGLGLNLMVSLGEGNDNGGGEAFSSTENHGTVKEEEMFLDGELANASFDCGDASYEDNKAIGMAVAEEGNKWKIKLRLDYESVITAWSTQGSPWANGQRPKLDSNGCFPDFLRMIWAGGAEPQGGVCAGGSGGGVSQTIAGDAGREAKVSRYREKRRTRLFSKKIRYEVRKLNAEKRPRMKGRFVKRTSFAA